MNLFEILKRDGRARIGQLKTPHGILNTPALLPVVNHNVLTITPKEMEEKYGFKETVNNKFFRVGKKDNWKNELSNDLARKLEKNFKNEMIELGHL